MRVITYDTETPLIRPGLQAPPMVCLQWCQIHEGGRIGSPSVELPGTALPRLVEWLRDPETLLVGAETAFDVLVPCTTADIGYRHLAPELGLDPDCPGTSLLELFVQAYDQNRVSDIFVRQKLIDLARGCYRFERSPEGRIVGVNKYNLADLSKRIGGLELPGESKRCQVCANTGCPACPPRLRYAEMTGRDPSTWPREFYEYAALDPYATALVWVNQWRPSEHIARNFPGRTTADALAREFDEARAALALKAMSAYGLRTDPAAVASFEAWVNEQYSHTVEECLAWGLVERKHKRDRQGLQAWLQSQGLLGHFTRRTKDGPPAVSFAKSCFDSALAATSGPVRETLRKVSLDLNDDPELMALGISYREEKKKTKPVIDLIVKAWGGEVPPGQINDPTEAEKKKAAAEGREPEGNIKADKDSLLLAADQMQEQARAHKELGSKQAWVDWFEGAADALRSYAALTHLSKQLSTDIPILREGSHRPISTRFETILETTRTSSSGPNVQNQARGGAVKCFRCKGTGGLGGIKCPTCEGKGKVDRPGARECFVPRRGWVILDSDYPMLELHTLAQTCLWELGFSTLATALKEGKDPHTIVASQIMGLTYDEVRAILKDENHPRHKEAKNARNAGKAVNFGRPGGLSAKTMRSYAVKSYGVDLPESRWKEIIETWNGTWAEMPYYFQKINEAESYPRSGQFNIEYSGLSGFRAGATYCAASNSKYQRLGAQVAKRSLWLVFKACYTRHAEGSGELFGCRPVNFIHDQILAEAPEERAHEAAVALGDLMRQAALELLPDIPMKMEPIVCRRWSKDAKEVRDDQGRLIAWEDVRLAV